MPHNAWMRVSGGILAAVVVALLPVGGAVAGQARVNPADEAAARSSVLKRSDLPPGFGWKATRNPSASAGAATSHTCQGFNSKDSGLVTTGSADAKFTGAGTVIDSSAEVLATPGMVAADFRRTYVPSLASCLARFFESGTGNKAKIVSSTKIGFPRYAPYTAAYRIVYRVTVKGAAVQGVVDLVALGGGRKELSLLFLAVVGPPSQTAQGERGMSVIEQRLAAVLVDRALTPTA